MSLELGVIGNCEIAALVDSMVGILISAVRLSRSWEDLV
jgi:hypothetical protein